MSINVIILFCLLIGLAGLLRIIPHFLSPAGAGIDHWFWKKYIKTYREERVFPPVIRQYLLDEYQWYPPIFPLILMLIPAKIFDRFNHLLAIAIDILRMLLLLVMAYYFTDGDLEVILMAGLIYLTTPIQVSYNFQLNPRGLAALFLDGLLLLLLCYYSYHGSAWLWVGAVFISSLILLTHKMTTQLFWFICLCCSLIYHDIRLFLLIPASILFATLISKGYYLKVLVAHYDIVRFWKKHWYWIGADAVRESPVYGDINYQRPEKLHKSGFKGFKWHWFILFGFNPASWIACFLIFERIFIEPHVIIYSSWLILWLLIPCLLAVITTFVPAMRCIGAGYLYLYNTSLITSLLLAMAFRFTKIPSFSMLIYFTALAFNIVGVCLFYMQFKKNKRSRIDESFNTILEKLANLPVGTVWCIPSSWHEPIAYKTMHQVLWGGHGFGFKHLTSTFPRILLPVYELIAKYKINYLLVMGGTLTTKFIDDMPEGTTSIKEGDYILYRFPVT